jgi:hypothetical protein
LSRWTRKKTIAKTVVKKFQHTNISAASSVK